jgi:hypothetical protein
MTLIIGSSYLAGSLLTWAIPILLVIGLLTFLFRATSRLPSNEAPRNGQAAAETLTEGHQADPTPRSPDPTA